MFCEELNIDKTMLNFITPMYSMSNFIIFVGSHCAEINIEIDADALPPDRIKDARRLGIQTNRLPRPIPAETFIRARFKKLIGQEKDDRNKVLTDEQCMKWTRMISCLEDMDRKLLSVDPKLPSVDRDKLTLILYCPSQHSAQQLQEPLWISTWEQEFTTMAHALGKLKLPNSVQRRIQDFPEGETTNYLAKNCMKMKKIGQRGGVFESSI